MKKDWSDLELFVNPKKIKSTMKKYKKMIKALKFYADKNNWVATEKYHYPAIDEDIGAIARNTLEDIGEMRYES